MHIHDIPFHALDSSCSPTVCLNTADHSRWTVRVRVRIRIRVMVRVRARARVRVRVRARARDRARVTVRWSVVIIDVKKNVFTFFIQVTCFTFFNVFLFFPTFFIFKNVHWKYHLKSLSKQRKQIGSVWLFFFVPMLEFPYRPILTSIVIYLPYRLITSSEATRRCVFVYVGKLVGWKTSTFFIQRLQTFFILVTFFTFLACFIFSGTFFYIYGSDCGHVRCSGRPFFPTMTLPALVLILVLIFHVA